MDRYAGNAKRPRFENRSDVPLDCTEAEKAFVIAAETVLSSGRRPPQTVLDMCRKLMAVHRTTSTAQDSMLVCLPCWSRFVVLLDPRTSGRLAATARWSQDKLQIKTRELRGRFLSIVGHRESFNELQETSELSEHQPFAVEIVAGRVQKVKFILDLGVDPNSSAHCDGGFVEYTACPRCVRALPALREWTFYDLARVMATGPAASSRHKSIEALLRSHGGISSKILCSRRELFERFLRGDRHDPCELYKLFDDSVRLEESADEDERFRDAEAAEETRRAAVAAASPYSESYY